jgi:hypothetical protein
MSAYGGLPRTRAELFFVVLLLTAAMAGVLTDSPLQPEDRLPQLRHQAMTKDSLRWRHGVAQQRHRGFHDETNGRSSKSMANLDAILEHHRHGHQDED